MSRKRKTAQDELRKILEGKGFPSQRAFSRAYKLPHNSVNMLCVGSANLNSAPGTAVDRALAAFAQIGAQKQLFVRIQDEASAVAR